ncbi:alginate export family protein [Thalassoroseus pseudoceratinae]|uniref:alginate export family protein n=1 Tax=Thalassoroseus pseudoceratinae TaxID=2713176 RepID=UPI0014220A6D|nr:alginate export family protein [Thalassoroseus pseudoceratinae]
MVLRHWLTSVALTLGGGIALHAQVPPAPGPTDSVESPNDSGEFATDEAPAEIDAVTDDVASTSTVDSSALARFPYGARTTPTPPASPTVQPWKVNFFDNDFSYKNKPGAPYFLGENLKDMPLFTLFDDDWTLSIGGELRNRYHDERNRLVPGGPGLSSYNLFRWRQYFDAKAGDHFRLYFEGIDASQFGEELPATPIDVNRWDVQNAFADLKIGSYDDQPIWFRYGRQELLYGAQRLISPLDYSNTRRNFEGFKAFTKLGDWKIDAFTVRPVNSATGNAGVPQFDNASDSPDQSRTFQSVYATYSGVDNNTFDFYWMWLREQDERARPPRFPDGSRQLVGMRWAGKRAMGPGTWSWDNEGGYQFGHDEFDETVQAGFATGILNYTFSDMPWKPKFTGLVWWGSGDEDPNDDYNNTFVPYFPLGHAYWGLIDNLGGPNLLNYSLQASVQPHKKINVLFAYHWFDLASDNDVLYNVAQAPLGRPVGEADIGQEFDILVNYVYNPNFAIQLQYAEFFYGDYVDLTLPRDDARQFFVQTTLRY